MIWKLKQGVKWHDGQPFTADDVVFNWKYAADPATAAVTSGVYTGHQGREDRRPHRAHRFRQAEAVLGRGLRRQQRHDHPEAFVRAVYRREVAPGARQPVAGRHRLPTSSRNSTRAIIVTGVINARLPRAEPAVFRRRRDEGRRRRRLGRARRAADRRVRLRLEPAGRGQRAEAARGRRQGAHRRLTKGANIEHIQLNTTDPNKEVDGERSSIKTKHPTLSDPAVRQALKLLIDRASVQKYIYGRTGEATGELRQRSGTVRFQEHLVGIQCRQGDGDARQGRLEAGSRRHPRQGRQQAGIRVPDLDQPPRQQNQEIIKAACKQAGINIKIKAVLASVYFSSDAGNPDTYTKFYADMQMYTTQPARPDPGKWMQSFLSTEVADKANKWPAATSPAGAIRSSTRPGSRRRSELDPMKRAAMLIKCNDMVDQRHRGDPGNLPLRRLRRGEEPARVADRLGQQHLQPVELVQGRDGVVRPGCELTTGRVDDGAS